VHEVAMGSERPDAEAPGIVLTLFGQVTGAVESCGGVSVLAADLCGAVTLWSDGARRLYGFDGTEIVGQPLSLLDVDGSVQGMWERTRRLGSWEGPVQRVRKDGSRFTARVSATPVLGADGNPEGYVFVSSDVNDEAMLRRELEDERRYERSLFDASGDAMVTVDDAGVIRRANEASERTFGYGHAELVGQPVEMLLPARDRADHPERRASFSSRPCGRAMAAGADFAGLRKDGVEITLEITLTPHPSETGPMVTAEMRDVTDSRRAADLRAAVMQNMAEGVWVMDRRGRLVMMNAAASSMLGWSEAELIGKPVHAAIHYLHPDGSAYPEEDCRLMRLRSEGEAAVGHDAFVAKDGRIVPISYSASRLLDGASENGVVVVFHDTTEEHAERARAQRALDELTWVGRIRDALDENRLVLYAQPIIPLRGGHPRSELLLRMVAHNGEIIPPGAFLAAAEKHGLIGEIDRWVIKHATALAADGLTVHANISAHSIADSGLLADIEHWLHELGADPARVIFELTETALMDDIDAGERFTRGLNALGCAVALDDFGTGFGSLTYLQRLPVRYLKIDIEFVRDLTTKAASRHLVTAIVNLAKGFEQETIAEPGCRPVVGCRSAARSRLPGPRRRRDAHGCR